MSRGYWRVKLDDVTLSGGSGDAIDCETDEAMACLTVPPAGLGMAELRTEDVAYIQRDGVRHFSDWHNPRIITLEGVTVGGGGCSCLPTRQAVAEIMSAWSRRCDDAELVIYTDCHGSDPENRALVGPFGAVGRPRVADLIWDEFGNATMTLRFDALDHRLFILDECGTPGSGTVSQRLDLGVAVPCRTYPRCYGSTDGGGQVVNRNRLVNPAVSGDTEGWGGTGTTSVVYVEEPTWVGQGSMQATFTGSSGNAQVNVPSAYRFAVTGGETVAAMLHFQPADVTRRARAALQTYDSADASLGTVLGPYVGVEPTWTEAAALLQVPEGAVWGRLIGLIETPATGEIHYVDGGMVADPEEVTTVDEETGEETVTLVVPEYFDGDTVDPTGGYVYSWTGTPNDSPSVKRTASEGAGGWCYDGGETQRGGPGEPITFTVGGTLCVHPVITFHGTLTDPYIEDIDTGATIGYDGTVTTLQTVTIDTDAGTAISGGGNVIFRVTGNPQFPIGPDETTLRLVSSGASDDGWAEISWRPATGWA